MSDIPLWLRSLPSPARTPEDAAAFVDQVGFCTWTPLKRYDFPNLAGAMGMGEAHPYDVLDRTWRWCVRIPKDASSGTLRSLRTEGQHPREKMIFTSPKSSPNKPVSSL